MVRLCCHATTISYEGSAIESIQVMALTVLRELLARFGDVRDDDDRAKLYLEQYVVQVGMVSAVRRVMSPNCGVRGMAASVRVLALLVTKRTVQDDGECCEAG